MPFMWGETLACPLGDLDARRSDLGKFVEDWHQEGTIDSSKGKICIKPSGLLRIAQDCTFGPITLAHHGFRRGEPGVDTDQAAGSSDRWHGCGRPDSTIDGAPWPTMALMQMHQACSMGISKEGIRSAGCCIPDISTDYYRLCLPAWVTYQAAWRGPQIYVESLPWSTGCHSMTSVMVNGQLLILIMDGCFFQNAWQGERLWDLNSVTKAGQRWKGVLRHRLSCAYCFEAYGAAGTLCISLTDFFICELSPAPTFDVVARCG